MKKQQTENDEKNYSTFYRNSNAETIINDQALIIRLSQSIVLLNQKLKNLLEKVCVGLLTQLHITLLIFQNPNL